MGICFFRTFYQRFRIFKEWFQFLCYDWSNFFSYFTNNTTSNAVLLYRFQHITNGFISGTCRCRLRKVSWSVSVAIGLSVMLNVAAGEGISTVRGGSIEERELLNEELERETGDGAWSNSWIFNISLFTL